MPHFIMKRWFLCCGTDNCCRSEFENDQEIEPVPELGAGYSSCYSAESDLKYKTCSPGAFQADKIEEASQEMSDDSNLVESSSNTLYFSALENDSTDSSRPVEALLVQSPSSSGLASRRKNVPPPVQIQPELKIEEMPVNSNPSECPSNTSSFSALGVHSTESSRPAVEVLGVPRRVSGLASRRKNVPPPIKIPPEPRIDGYCVVCEIYSQDIYRHANRKLHKDKDVVRYRHTFKLLVLAPVGTLPSVELTRCQSCRKIIYKGRVRSHQCGSASRSEIIGSGWFYCLMCQISFRREKRFDEHCRSCHAHSPGGPYVVTRVEGVVALVPKFTDIVDDIEFCKLCPRFVFANRPLLACG